MLSDRTVHEGLSPAHCTECRKLCMPGTGFISMANCTGFNRNRAPFNFSSENPSEISWRNEQIAVVRFTVVLPLSYIVISLYKKAYYAGWMVLLLLVFNLYTGKSTGLFREWVCKQ